MYKHDIESYVITIRRKGVVSSAAPVEEVLKPAQPVHKIEKPVREPSVMPVPVPEVSSVADSGVRAAGGKAIKSPLPGVIVAVKVNAGDKVKAGDVEKVLWRCPYHHELQAVARRYQLRMAFGQYRGHGCGRCCRDPLLERDKGN